MFNRFIGSVILLIILCFFCLQPVLAQSPSHPFLIVKASQYQDLRNKAAQYPWSEMKAGAISDCNALNYVTTTSIQESSDLMRDVVSACSLAYILDTSNTTTYKNKVRDTLLKWNELHDLSVANRWTLINTGTAFFDSVLALDVVYNDLTSVERTSIETSLQSMADLFLEPVGIEEPELSGIEGIWELYKYTNRTAINDWKAQYKSHVLSMITDNGVFKEGGMYGTARYSGERDANQHFMDVLEFTGEDNTFYTNPTLQKFYEWIYGYSYSPFGLYLTFGDSAAFDGIYYWDHHRSSSSMLRAYRFSPLAAQYAAFRHRDYPWPGRLLHYVLAGQAMPPAAAPGSRVFSDGGAFFWENPPTDNSLMGALWNVKTDTTSTINYHSTMNVNAIVLFAYGEPVLMNGGYDSPSSDNYDWTHYNAASSNIVEINQTNHNSYLGGGIGENILTSYFDYASGSSGSALNNGNYQRNFIFIHPQDGINGYFINFDEITANQSNSTANVFLHPNADAINIVTNNQEYTVSIGPHQLSNNQTQLSMFLAENPSTVNLSDGIIADWSYTFLAKYLNASYDLGSTNKRNLITVLFPYDATHAKAAMSRVSGSGYTGATVDHGGGRIDTALESSTPSQVSYNGVAFTGKEALFRKNNNNLTFYFVRKGSSFGSGSYGFGAGSDVSIFLKDRVGKIISPGTQVTFNYPGITGIKINSQLVSGTPGANSYSVNVPSGTYDIELMASPQLTATPTSSAVPGDANGDGHVDGIDYVIWLNHYGQSIAGGASVGDFNGDGHTDGVDYVIWLNNYGK